MVDLVQRQRSDLLNALLARGYAPQQPYAPTLGSAFAQAADRAIALRQYKAEQERQEAQAEEADQLTQQAIEALGGSSVSKTTYDPNAPMPEPIQDMAGRGPMLPEGAQVQTTQTAPDLQRALLLASQAGMKGSTMGAGLASVLLQQQLGQKEDFTLSKGAQRYDASGNLVADNPADPEDNRTTTQKDVEWFSKLSPEDQAAAERWRRAGAMTLNMAQPSPDQSQDDVLQGFNTLRMLDIMEENVGVTGRIRGIQGKVEEFLGTDEQAVAFGTAANQFAIKMQSLVPGIPSDKDQKLVTNIKPGFFLPQEVNLSRIRVGRQMTKDLVRGRIAFLKGTKAQVPPDISAEARELGIDVDKIAPATDATAAYAPAVEKARNQMVNDIHIMSKDLGGEVEDVDQLSSDEQQQLMLLLQEQLEQRGRQQ